ncbi:WXG100 family type VII secretion target [Streptomyces sp. NPDC004542]|uniref:WXG100 family type VII secretion target n=1 Tax=Streptomyces sp. NPDC004542 TaxID=3154281 RepID=UPI0033A4207E
MASNLEAVDLAGMQQSAQVHLQTLENHRASFARMRDLATRAEQGWQGEAGTAFQQALEGWMANYQKIGSVLDEMHQRILATGNVQGQAHQATKQTASQLAGTTVQPVALKGF